MKTKKQIFLFLLIFILLITIYYFKWPFYLTLANIKQQKELFLVFIKNNYWLTVVSYILSYCAVTALSLPGAAPLSLLGGFLFGILPGTFFTVISATSGAVLAFLLVRTLIGETLQKKYENQLRLFNKELKKSGFFYLLSLRLVPVFPFFLINILAGLTKISLKKFFFSTMLGIIPGTFVFSFAGNHLQTINQLSDVFSLKIILVFCLLALLALLPIIHKKLQKKPE